MFSSDLTCTKCAGNIGDAVEQDEKLSSEVKTVREFAYLSVKVSAGGGCETAVFAEIRFGWLSLGSTVRYYMERDLLCS